MASDNNDDYDPYYDPYDEFGHFTDEALRNLMSDTVPDLSDLPFTHNPLPPPPPPPLLPPPPPPTTTTTQAMEMNETHLSQLEPRSSTSEFSSDNDYLWSPLEEDFALPWNMFKSLSVDLNNNTTVNNFLGENNTNGSNNVGGSTRLEVITRVLGDTNGPNFETGGPSRMPVPVSPPVSEGIFLCACCNLIRQLVHVNGREIIRLDIHGGSGSFCHAVLDAKLNSNKRILQTFHFKDLRMEDVNKFIEDYCSWKEVGGFTLLRDSNSAFSQAMNGFTIDNQLIPRRGDVPLSLAIPNEALGVPPLPLHVGLREETTKPKKVRLGRQTRLAAQRERTRNLTVKDLSIYFHVPMQVAARRMSLCSTSVKKICRKGAFDRWPHRKISSIEKKITTLTRMLESAKDAEVRARIEQQIETLQKEIHDIYGRAFQNS